MMEGPRGDMLIILHHPDDCKGLSTRLGGSLGPSCASACRGRMANRPLAALDLGSGPRPAVPEAASAGQERYAAMQGFAGGFIG